MEKKKLIILSGAGDPENEKYKKVYNLITNYAKKLNYEDIIIHGWTGQESNAKKGVLNMTESTESAILLFKKIESDNVPYDVICRSFGTGVFLNMCQKLELSKIGFASLWGIPAYTSFYELFKEKIEETKILSKNKGVNIDDTFFDTVIPFDLLLNKFNQEFKVNIINGSQDVYSPPAYYLFMKNYFKRKNLNFSFIDELPHEVTEYHQEYLEKIFNINV